MVWLKFVLCLAIILIAGTKLSRYGDAIAEKTGLSGVWVGLILIAIITSMPELVTGVSAAAWVKNADLPLGMLFGSNMLNLTIIAMMDVLYRPVPLLSNASRSHMASAGLGLLLIAIAAVTIAAGEGFSGLALGWFGVSSIIILLAYIVGVRWLFRLERSQERAEAPESLIQYGEMSKQAIYVKFAVAAVAIIGAGIWLSFIGDEIAQATGWGASFVGSLFIAITTSLPEVVVAIAALRLDAVDMALATMLGSNIFNVTIIIPLDIAYTREPVLAAVSPAHIVTALVVIAMSALVIAGIRFRTKRKTFAVVSWYSVALVALYIFGAYAAFTAGLGLG